MSEPDYAKMNRGELVDALKRLMREEADIHEAVERAAHKALASVRAELSMVKLWLSVPDEIKRQ